MANITLSETPTSAESAFVVTKKSPTTSSKEIFPVFSSVVNVTQAPLTPQNFPIENLDAPGTGTRSSVRGFLRGRRPYRGLLFPRGYYNR